jgi:hypothetical protein
MRSQGIPTGSKPIHLCKPIRRLPAALVSAHPFHRSTDSTDSQSLKLKWNLDYAAILAEAVAKDFDCMRMQSCDP